MAQIEFEETIQRTIQKKFLTDFLKPVSLAPTWKEENETKNSSYKFQTLFMVVAGQSYGVACANATIQDSKRIVGNSKEPTIFFIFERAVGSLPRPFLVLIERKLMKSVTLPQVQLIGFRLEDCRNDAEEIGLSDVTPRLAYLPCVGGMGAGGNAGIGLITKTFIMEER